MLDITDKLLPDYCYPGRDLPSVDGVIVHYFSCKNVEPIERAHDMLRCYHLFMDLNRPRDEREYYMITGAWPEKRHYASAHVLIGRDGTIWRMVPFDQVAWHAGTSLLGGRIKCNEWTLGIELVGGQGTGFTQIQYENLAWLLAKLEAEHGFKRENVAGHDAVRHNARQSGQRKAKKKYDPTGAPNGQGDNFDWYMLGKLWNDISANPAGVNTLADLEETLEADPLSG